MESYSQNKEDLIIYDYYTKHKGSFGTVVEFGSNNGIDLSNSKLFIDNGFKALLIEPSLQFNKLKKLHKSNVKVTCLNIAVSDKVGKMTFYESGEHVKGGKDKALVSTLDKSELKRWPNVKFTERIVDVIDVPTLRCVNNDNWDIISIDIEGQDWNVLKQIDLNEVGCKVLCIEHNSDFGLARRFINYCAKFGMKEIHRNAENLIFGRI